MTEPIRRAGERCRHCRRDGIDAHRADCPYAAEEPLPDDQVFDPGAYGRLEDQQLADRFGEPRRYFMNDDQPQPNPPCRGVLMITGEFFACDWPTDTNGTHDGWAHANKQAQAIWADAPTTSPPQEQP